MRHVVLLITRHQPSSSVMPSDHITLQQAAQVGPLRQRRPFPPCLLFQGPEGQIVSFIAASAQTAISSARACLERHRQGNECCSFSSDSQRLYILRSAFSVLSAGTINTVTWELDPRHVTYMRQTETPALDVPWERWSSLPLLPWPLPPPRFRPHIKK